MTTSTFFPLKATPYLIVFYQRNKYNKRRNKSKKGGTDYGENTGYGSVARGTATEESDIDIMVLIDGTAQELRAFEDQLSDVSTDISIKYFKVFSIIDISYQEYMRWMNMLPFYRNVSQEGVVLYAA